MIKTLLLFLSIISFSFQEEGFATRYWDCCKPSCSWTDNAGAGNEARECDLKNQIITDHTAVSNCLGGPSMTCYSQIPWAVNDKLAYAFAAVPGANSQGTCGKCFELTFTGEGKYETHMNHQKMAGKTLIVMASNIGYDVSGGQFDILIPGGGVGAFDGCSALWGEDIGMRTGGLLYSCEIEVGYNDSEEEMYIKRKQCLAERCKKTFASFPDLMKGCLFLSDWMEAAGNPTHKYKQVDCPAELKEKY